MKKTLIYSLTTGLLMHVTLSVVVKPGQSQSKVGPDRVALGAQPHPNITRAIHALEAARSDLQNAAHQYWGHRVEALQANNAPLSPLQVALRCERR